MKTTLVKFEDIALNINELPNVTKLVNTDYEMPRC